MFSIQVPMLILYLVGNASLVALDSNGFIAVAAIIVTLWTVSMGGAWKIATILSKISNELVDLREDHKELRADIVTIQRRFNIPQQDEEGHHHDATGRGLG
jgi:hypothetical protein